MKDPAWSSPASHAQSDVAPSATGGKVASDDVGVLVSSNADGGKVTGSVGARVCAPSVTGGKVAWRVGGRVVSIQIGTV